MKVYTTDANVVITPVREDGSTRFITVFLGRRNHKVRRNWRCQNCGRIVFQYNGEIELIYDGAIEPQETSDIQIMCNRCKILFILTYGILPDGWSK